MKYNFKKGNHYPSFHYPLPHKAVSVGCVEVVFSTSCWYKDTDWERDWNKLYGWSYGILPSLKDRKLLPAHHLNSDRLVWRPSLVEGLLEVKEYSYKDGVIDYSDNNHLHQVLIEHPTILPLSPSQQGWGYTLSPYHGGTNPAPQDYTIIINRL